MKALLFAMTLSLMLLPVAGCETLTETPGENFTRVVHSSSTDVREVPTDVESDVLMVDRPSWLSRAPVPME